jgi:hypothetical protein
MWAVSEGTLTYLAASETLNSTEASLSPHRPLTNQGSMAVVM